MQDNRKMEKGVTLVELLVVITIMVIVLVPIVTITTLFTGQSQEVMTTNNLQQEARLIIDYVTDYVHRLDETFLIYSNGSLGTVDGNYFLHQHGNQIYKGDGVVLSYNVHPDSFIEIEQHGQNQAIILNLVLDNEQQQYTVSTKIFTRDRHILKTFDSEE